MLDVIMLAIGLASSRCRSATRSPAIDFRGFDAFSTANRKPTSPENALQENSHDLRLFARRPRDRGAPVLPHLRSAAARAVLKRRNDHDRHRLDSNPALLRDRRRARAAARRLHDARVQRRAHVPVAGPAAGRGRALLDRRRRREARAALGDLHGRHAVLPRRRLSHPLCADAPAGGAAVQSGRAVGGGARTSPSTRR